LKNWKTFFNQRFPNSEGCGGKEVEARRSRRFTAQTAGSGEFKMEPPFGSGSEAA